jgi:hypothetical protein
MTKAAIPTRVVRIHRRDDGRFECRNEDGNHGPLGVDTHLGMALGTASREATAISREEGCRVIIEVELPSGQFKRECIIEPPPRASGPRGV